MSVKEEQKETATLREDTAAQWRRHPRAELHTEVPTSGKDIEIHAQDDYVLVNTHGEARLDRDGLVTLRKRLEQCFQVVA